MTGEPVPNPETGEDVRGARSYDAGAAEDDSVAEPVREVESVVEPEPVEPELPPVPDVVEAHAKLLSRSGTWVV